MPEAACSDTRVPVPLPPLTEVFPLQEVPARGFSPTACPRFSPYRHPQPEVSPLHTMPEVFRLIRGGYSESTFKEYVVIIIIRPGVSSLYMRLFFHRGSRLSFPGLSSKYFPFSSSVRLLCQVSHGY
jgi:hypothetical protein